MERSDGSNPLKPETVVQNQLDAYNARDIDAFMALWAEDAQYFQHPATLLAAGHDAIRARHAVRFQEPELFGRLVNRIAVGNTVVDHEIVTRNFPEGRGTVEVIATYEVGNDKITKAWFILGEPILDANAAGS